MFPNITVETSLTTDPLATPAWEDQSAYGKAVSYRSGREQALEGQFDPGTATVALDNPDRRFDPEHASGPHYGDLVPGKRLRITAEVPSVLDSPALTGPLEDAVLLLRASQFTGDPGDDWPNEGTGGSALDAVADGAPVWTDTPTPRFRLGDGSSGTTDVGPYFSVPDSALLRPGTGSATAFAYVNTVAAAVDLFENIMVMLDNDTGVGTGVLGDGATGWGIWDEPGFLLGAAGVVADEGLAPGTNPTWSVAASNLSVGEHLLVLRIDRDTDLLTLFVDGTAATSADISGVADISPQHDVIIGRANEQDGIAYGYWDRALTDDEIAALGAQAFDLFGGFVNGWPQTYRGTASADCVVGATDGFTMLNLAEVGVSPFETYIEALGPVHWWKLNEPADADVVVDYGSGLLDGTPKGQAVTGLGADGLDTSDATALELTADGGFVDLTGAQEWTSLTFTARIDSNDALYERIVWDSPTRRVKIMSDALGLPGAISVNQGSGTGNRTNVSVVGSTVQVTIVRTGSSTFKLYLNGVDATDASTTGTSTLALASTTKTRLGRSASATSRAAGLLDDFDGVIQHVATFDYQLSADDAAALGEAWLAFEGLDTGATIDRLLDLAGWPAADRYLDTGTVTLGASSRWSDTILEAARDLEASEAGAFYQLPDYTMRFRNRYDHLTATRSTTPRYVFTDATSGTYRYEDLGFPEQSTYLYNRVKVTWSGGEVVVTDPTSITAYGPREHSVATVLPTAAQARALGEWIIDHHAAPVLRIDQVVLNPGADERLWVPCLDLQIGDRITIRRHPQQVGTAIEADVIVEGIQADINQGINQALFTLSVSAADTVEYWTWDTSTWGETTRWA